MAVALPPLYSSNSHLKEMAFAEDLCMKSEAPCNAQPVISNTTGDKADNIVVCVPAFQEQLLPASVAV